MDDLTLVATLDDSSTLYVTSLDALAYSEYVEGDRLGGTDGYFVVRETASSFEVLAKAATFEAAGSLFDLITARRRRRPARPKGTLDELGAPQGGSATQSTALRAHGVQQKSPQAQARDQTHSAEAIGAKASLPAIGGSRFCGACGAFQQRHQHWPLQYDHIFNC